MPRGKKTVKKKKKPNRPTTLYPTPAVEYIFTTCTLNTLAEAWRGRKGCAYGTLGKRCANERWKEKRKDHQNRMLRESEKKILAKQSDERSAEIEERGKVHRRQAEALQSVGMVALGIAEKFELVSRMDEYQAYVFETLEIFVTDLDTFRAIGERLTEFGERTRREVEAEVGPVLEAKVK